MPQIFVSYSRKDLTFIECLAADLKKYGFDVWYDISRLDGGARWNRVIEQAIKDSQYAIVVLSPDSVISEYVEDEVVFARKLKKKVVPLYYRPCDLGMIWVNLHYIDVQGGNYGSNFERILRALDVSSASSPSNSKKIIEPAPKQKEKPVEEKKPVSKVLNTPSEWLKKDGDLNIYLSTSRNKLTLSNGMEFMRVPEGKFLMGSKNDNKLAYGNECPQHAVDIPYAYWMAHFPITNDLYNVYVKSKKSNHPVNDWEAKKDHPVVNVSWHDAVGYCNWLNQNLHSEIVNILEIRLPTEAEWEKAARGPNGREYPWGNSFDKSKCNFKEGGKRTTTPVGSYSPKGDSPYGCADMSGNVWEWTYSLLMPYPYKINDGRDYGDTAGDRVVRGGSFLNFSRGIRCAYRLKNAISDFYDSIGFRVVVAPPLPK